MDKKTININQAFLDGSVQLSDTKFISILEQMCPQLECPLLTPEGVPLQWDAHHLTGECSEMIGKVIFPLLTEEL